MTSKKKDKIKDFVYKLSAILILIAAVCFMFNPTVAKFIMIVGVVGFAITTFMSPYPGTNIRGKRLYNIHIFGVVFMVMSTYLMFEEMNEWVIPMLIGAILIIYSSILLPKVYAKEEANKKNLK